MEQLPQQQPGHCQRQQRGQHQSDREQRVGNDRIAVPLAGNLASLSLQILVLAVEVLALGLKILVDLDHLPPSLGICRHQIPTGLGNLLALPGHLLVLLGLAAQAFAGEFQQTLVVIPASGKDQQCRHGHQYQRGRAPRSSHDESSTGK